MGMIRRSTASLSHAFSIKWYQVAHALVGKLIVHTKLLYVINHSPLHVNRHAADVD